MGAIKPETYTFEVGRSATNASRRSEPMSRPGMRTLLYESHSDTMHAYRRDSIFLSCGRCTDSLTCGVKS